MVIAKFRKKLPAIALGVAWGRSRLPSVRGAGVEPARFYPPEPKSGASASSAILASTELYPKAQQVGLGGRHRRDRRVRIGADDAVVAGGVVQEVVARAARFARGPQDVRVIAP